MNTFVQIGNSDDKLTQRDWVAFIREVREHLNRLGQVHGEWFSAPDSQWQNANWCVEFPGNARVTAARQVLRRLAAKYGQDSIAWTQGDVEFLTAE